MRPQRQARSSVSYAESVSDDDFSPPVTRSSRKSIVHKKNAAVEEVHKVSSSSSAQKRKERPNPKERAEAMQLERAIRESLNDVDREVPDEPSTSFCGAAAAGVVKPSIAFQCLLDVTYQEESESKALETDHRQEDEVSLKSDFDSQNQNECSIVLQEEHSRDTSSSLPESEMPSSMPNAELQKQNFHSFRRVKKKRLLNEEHKDEAKDAQENDITNRSSMTEEVLDADPEEQTSRKLLEAEEKAPKDETNKVSTGAVQEDSKALKPEAAALKCFSRVKQAGVKKARMTATAAAESAGLLSHSSQRRVVGLSRRFRPPSLHPYLMS